MQRSERMEVAWRLLVEKLECGQMVDADEILTAAGVEVPAKAADRLWRRTVVRSLAHRAGEYSGFQVISLGGGRFKRIETVEEVQLADRRARRQLVGQALRRRLMKKHPAARDPNQLQLTFDECEVSQDANTTPGAAEQSS